ncbi:hypothetical protein HAX54_004118, partial [Datura stramonium]|nr:hypothetical protein [Datura stramonium]
VFLKKVARTKHAWISWDAEEATGATFVTTIEEWERKSEVRDRKMIAIMELPKALTRKVMETKASQIEWGVNLDVRGPLVEMVTTNHKCVKCCGDRIIRGSKALRARVESVDGENNEQHYEVMLFESD